MAVSITNTYTGRNSTGDLTISNVVVGINDNGIILLTSVQDSNHSNYPIVSVTRDDQSFTKIAHYEPAGNVRVEAWYLAAPTVGTSDIDIDVTGGVGEFTGHAVVMSGVDVSDMIDDYDGGSGNGFAGSVTVTTSVENDMLLHILCAEADIVAVGAGQTTIQDYQDQSYENALSSYKAATTATDYTMSANMASGQPYAQIAIAVKATLSSDIVLENIYNNTYEDKTSHSIAFECSGDNRLLVLAFNGREFTDNDRGIDSVNYNGDSLTLLQEQDDASNNNNSSIWYLINPDTGTNNVNITYRGENADFTISLFCLSGVDQSSPVEDSDKNSGTAATFSFDLTTVSENCFLIANLTAGQGTASAVTPPSGWSQQYEVDLGLVTSSVISRIVTSSGVYDNYWTDESPTDDFVLAAAAFKTVTVATSDISKVAGVAQASISKISTIAEVSISKVSGVTN